VVLNTASGAGVCHCVWPYNVPATAALDISSSVCLAIKYQSQPHTHTYHFPSSLKVRDITVLAGSIVWATRRREKTTVLFGKTFQLETKEGENRNQGEQKCFK